MRKCSGFGCVDLVPGKLAKCVRSNRLSVASFELSVITDHVIYTC